MALTLTALNPSVSEPGALGVHREPPKAEAFERALGVAQAQDERAAAGASEARAHAPPGSRAPSAAVRPNRTELSGQQAGDAISAAFERITGEPPSEATLAILTSHWSLETGQGQKMYNFNFAGIKGRSPEGLTALMNTREGYGATEVRIRDGFRAYSSAESGAEDYVSLLTRKYGSAVEAAQAEDPVKFAMELKQGGYYTGNEQLYAQGITRLANRAMSVGLDAIGARPGELSSMPEPVEHYFEVPNFAPHGFGPSRMNAVLGLFGAGSGLPSAFSSGAMADELTRVALRIATEHGVKKDGA